MNNPLFNLANNIGNPIALLGTLKQDPIGMLMQVGFKAPSNINDPRAIIQHLLDSGQLTQSQLNQAQQFAKKIGA